MDNESAAQAINQAVGAELRGLRAKRQMSREKLRELTRLGLSTIQRFENGERSPDLPQLALILRALNMSMKDFLEAVEKDLDLE